MCHRCPAHCRMYLFNKKLLSVQHSLRQESGLLLTHQHISGFVSWIRSKNPWCERWVVSFGKLDWEGVPRLLLLTESPFLSGVAVPASVSREEFSRRGNTALSLIIDATGPCLLDLSLKFSFRLMNFFS